MITLTTYYKNILNFINSLTIKIDDIQIHQNYQTYVKYNRMVPEQSDSKYYQNICGIKNINDYTVYINAYENIELTREYLNNDYLLKERLRLFSTDFNTLCLNNPGMTDYIRGCLSDNEMSDVLDAPNYTILDYDKTFLLSNELSIISELNIYIKQYMSRFHNVKYITEELYMPSLLSGLYNALFLKVISLKVKNILSYKTDAYHREVFFKSYKSLNNEMDLFNLETNIWVYGNLKRMKKNIGKNNILDNILLTIFDNNSIGVNNIRYVSDLPTLITNNLEKYNKEYYKNNYTLLSIDANLSGYSKSNTNYPLEKLESLLYENELVGNVTSDLIIDEMDEILADKSPTTENASKLFILDTPEKLNTYYYNSLILAISNFINIKDKNMFTFTLDYRNTVDSKIYKLDMIDVENIIIYTLAKYYKMTSNEFTIKFPGVYDNPNKEVLMKKTWYKDKLTPIVDYIMNAKDLNLNIYNRETMRRKFKSIREIDTKTWYVLSNIVDNVAKTDINYLYSGLLVNKEITYDMSVIDEYLGDKDLYRLIDSNSLDIVTELLCEITGIPVDHDSLIIDKFKKTIRFFNKVTSYTIDLLLDDSFTRTDVDNNTLTNNLNLSYKSLMEVRDINCKFYEDLKFCIRDTNFLDYDIRQVRDSHIHNTNEYTELPCVLDYDRVYTIPMLTGKFSRTMGKKYTLNIDENVFSDRGIGYYNSDQLANTNEHIDYSPVVQFGSSPMTPINVTTKTNIDVHPKKYKLEYTNIEKITDHLHGVDILDTDKNNIFNIGSTDKSSLNTQSAISLLTINAKHKTFINNHYINGLKYTVPIGKELEYFENRNLLEINPHMENIPLRQIGTPSVSQFSIVTDTGTRFTTTPYKLAYINIKRIIDNLSGIHMVDINKNSIFNTGSVDNFSLSTQSPMSLISVKTKQKIFNNHYITGMQSGTYTETGITDVDTVTSNVFTDKTDSISLSSIPEIGSIPISSNIKEYPDSFEDVDFEITSDDDIVIDIVSN